MAIDREKVMRQFEEASSPFGSLQTLSRNSDTKLRILEYRDAEGHVVFAKKAALHLRFDHYLSFCRRETFGKNCLFCNVDRKNKRTPFSKLIFKFVVNAIEVDWLPSKVSRLMIPTIVFDRLCDYMLDDKYEDIMAPDTGRLFIVSSQRRELKTRYSVWLTNKVYPVGNDILNQIIDPTSAIPDPGLDEQEMILERLKRGDRKR